jgi:amino acid transporter
MKIENNNVEILGFQLFLLNNIIAGLSIYFLYWLALIRHKDISFEINREEKVKFNSQILFSTILFIIILLITFFTDNWQIVFWTIIICFLSRKVLKVYSTRKVTKQATKENIIK